MDKIVDSNFIVWVANFMSAYDLTLSYFPKFIEEVLSLLAKILYYDLNKQVKKISYTTKYLSSYRKGQRSSIF